MKQLLTRIAKFISCLTAIERGLIATLIVVLAIGGADGGLGVSINNTATALTSGY